MNTHHHYDHTFGNATFLPVPIWGHVRCAAVLLERGEDDRARVVLELPTLADELAAVRITPPDVTFDPSATLDLGDRQLELTHLGRGHTDNDVVVAVRDAGVLFAGDLYENGAPPSFGDAYPRSPWAATAGGLLELVPTVVAPGHGDPADRDFAERQTGELGAVESCARPSSPARSARTRRWTIPYSGDHRHAAASSADRGGGASHGRAPQ